MIYKEAVEWLKGRRSNINIIPTLPLNTWNVRIAEADAYCIQQAYWIVKAYKEGIVK